MTLKTVHGALIEFDIRSCDTVPNIQVRRGIHLGFVTGFGCGLIYLRDALETCRIAGVDDAFDFNRFAEIVNDYATQVMKAQADINV